MTIAGKKINIQSIHGRQYVKKDGGEWIEYLCVKHNYEKHIDIRVTDTIPVTQQLKLVAEEIQMLMGEKVRQAGEKALAALLNSNSPKKRQKGGGK